MNEAATNQLLNMGLPGIVILALVYVVIKLFNMVQSTNEARIAEMKTVTAAMTANSAAMDALSKVVDKRA